MKDTIKDLFTAEEWDYIKNHITAKIEDIADYPQTIDCEEVE